MKKKFIYLLIFSGTLALFLSCQKINNPPGNQISVNLNKCSGKTSPYICFDSLITDSRCPEGAECIWSGDALIKVTFHENGNIHKFGMSLFNYPHYPNDPAHYTNDTVIAGYQIRFKDLLPHPGINLPFPPTKIPEAIFDIVQVR